MEKQIVHCKVKLSKKEKTQYIEIIKRGDSWEYSDFLLAIAMNDDISVFDIEYIGDANGIEIPEGSFLNIFFERYLRADFVLTMKLKINTLESPGTIICRQNCQIGLDLYISSEELEEFIMDSTNSHVLLKKFASTKPDKLRDLTDVERRAVIREAVNLLTKKFGYHPESEHKMALALAIIKLFPQLKTQNSKIQGVDLLYNREENRGYILSRLYHVRNKLYKHESESLEIEPTTKSSKRRLNISEKNQYKKASSELPIPKNIEEELLILKHLNVTTQKEKIKEKLKITLHHREQQLRSQDGISISTDWPFFITCPDLILFDYDLRYPETNEAFIDNWPNIQFNIEEVWKSFKKPGTEFLKIEDWLPSFQRIFILLNLLPETSLGKLSAKSKRLTFQESMKRIIVFKPLNSTSEELKNEQFTCPYLIAVGESKKLISQFLLCIENELIPLPPSFEVKESIDILFKSHYVFNQHFDSSLKNFWTFISFYFFKIETKSIPTKIRDVINKLNIALSNNQV